MARYAKIANGAVENLVEIHFTNADKYPDYIPVEDFPVEPGDAYENGAFYRDGVQIKSAAQKLADTQMLLNIILGGEGA